MRMESLSGCRDIKRGLSASNWQHTQVKLFKELKKVGCTKSQPLSPPGESPTLQALTASVSSEAEFNIYTALEMTLSGFV